MLASIANDLSRCIKAHGLRIEQRRAENVRVAAFHPGGGERDLGEAGGMAFGEAVAAEALDLLEGPLGEVMRVAVLQHAADHLVAEVGDAAGGFEGCHRTAKRVCL